MGLHFAAGDFRTARRVVIAYINNKAICQMKICMYTYISMAVIEIESELTWNME